MVNVRDAPVRTVGSVVTVLIKRSSVDRVGRSNVACAGDASAYMYKHAHNAQSAEPNKVVPSLQEVLQDLSGTICMFRLKK